MTANNSKGTDKAPCICPAEVEPTPDFLTAHQQIVRKWLSQTPFAAFVTALRSGTRQDQLTSMRQVERWLLKCHPEALFGQYTRKRFLEEMQSLSGLFGLSLGSGLQREYQSKIPRRALMTVES